MIGVAMALCIYSELMRKEYEVFVTRQYSKGRHTPTRDQYMLGNYLSWLIDNPPSPPYFKTKLALLINAIANLIPTKRA